MSDRRYEWTAKCSSCGRRRLVSTVGELRQRTLCRACDFAWREDLRTACGQWPDRDLDRVTRYPEVLQRFVRS
jgi:hypothetical protein